jgi:predicted nuclease of restriction endonuclease-like RecB superfamily
LKRHLELLADYGPPNLVLAVSDRLKEGEDTLPPLPPHAIRFKKALRPASVRKAAEAVQPVHEIPPG